MSDITLTVSAPGPTVELTADAPGAVTVTVNEGGGVSTHAGLPDLATSGHPVSAITGALSAAAAAAAYQPLDADLTAIAALSSPATSITNAVPKTLVDAAGDLLVGTAADTVARLPLGSALQVLRVNAGATAPEWAAAAGGSSGLPLIGAGYGAAPGMVRLAFVEPVLTPGANTTVYMGPYQVDGDLTLGGGVFKIQALTGTANVRLAIISMNTTTWQPSAVVKDFGELTYTTTGQKVVTFSNVTIPAGWYFVGVRTDNATVAFSGMRVAPVVGWMGLETGYLTISHRTKAETYGAWSATPTAWDTYASGSTTGLWGLTHILDWRLGA